MARTAEDAPITTSASRRKLNARAKPHYRTIEPDLHLGFRKGETGGRWVVHYYTGQGKYRVETFAKAVTDDADGLPAAGLALMAARQPDRAISTHVESRRRTGPAVVYTPMISQGR